MKNDAIDPPIVNLNEDDKLDNLFEDNVIAQQSLIFSSDVPIEENILPSSPVDAKSDSFDRTMSTCEPIPDEHRGSDVLGTELI